MRYTVINPADVQMPDLLTIDGHLKTLASAEFDKIKHQDLRVWCHTHARYGLPTLETVAWLRDKIAGRWALEIGAGAGDLCRALGIVGVDNKHQNGYVSQHYYRMLGQPTIKYPDYVIEWDAVEAVRTLEPPVVIASWVTHWVDKFGPVRAAGGCMFGVKEDEIVARGCTYIMIGNLAVHAGKPIMDLPHEEFRLPFLRSRANDPTLDRVWVWNG